MCAGSSVLCPGAPHHPSLCPSCSHNLGSSDLVPLLLQPAILPHVPSDLVPLLLPPCCAVLCCAQERCTICFDVFPLGDMRSAPCKHFFCKECWRGYVSNAVASGPACLDLRCPVPDCKACVSPPPMHYDV